MEDNSLQNLSKVGFLTYYEKYMVVIGIFGQLMFYIQGAKIFVTQSANDVSILGFLLGLITVSSWLVYGILIKNRILVISNIFAVIGALFVIIGALLYSN